MKNVQKLLNKCNGEIREEEKMKDRAVIVGLLFFLLGTLLVSGCGKKAVMEEDSVTVKTQKIVLGNSSDKANYPGEIRGRYESQLAFQVGGKITARHVEVGSQVRTGDLLLEIDSKDIVENVHSGAAQVEAAKAQMRLAEANFQRYRQLYLQEAVSEMQYEQYRTAYDAAVAAWKQAQALYTQSSNSLSYSKLVADRVGVIALIQTEVGQIVAPGQSVVTLVRWGEKEVEIAVPENRLAALRDSKRIRVTFWALDQVQVDGKIREIAPMADPVSRTYKVRISLLHSPETVKLGMTANVLIINEDKNVAQTTLIPLTAIYQTGEKPQVWVVKNGSVQLRSVAIKSFGENQVQVVSGLEQGEVIVVAGVHQLRVGQKVQVLAGAKQ